MPSAPVAAAGPEARYIVVYDSAAQVNRGEVEARGDTIDADLGEAGLLVVRSTRPDELARLPGVAGVAPDRVRIRVPDEPVTRVEDPTAGVAGCASTAASCPRQWDLDRIHDPAAWRTTQGAPAVKVAVLDTGLTSSHEAVGANYDRAASRSFVQPNAFCPADAATFASTEDFQGHGTWTNTHVAGVNGRLMTGIAPRATLVNVRVLGACGFGLDSWVLAGMPYAGQIGAQVESMSLGGFLCADGVVPGSFYCGSAAAVGSDPVIWRAYRQLIGRLRERGTIVVAAAGNDHVQLDRRGRVVSAGTLADCTPTPQPCNDYRGLSEVPGGVPGVVAVAALNRVTAPGAPGETKFGQYGVGRRDQLSYYSNYGERIDVSAPGGARNYNVARFDCLSAACARVGPSSATATDNPGDFGAWGVDAAGKPCGTCYVYVQGTSMATPQVAGVAVLALSANRDLDPDGLAQLLRSAVSGFLDTNATPPIARDPARPTYNYDIDYGASGIANLLLGHGVIDAARAVKGGEGGGDQGDQP